MRLLLFLFGLFSCFSSAFAAIDYSKMGGSFYYALITQDPENLHGYRAALWYEPKSLVWPHTHIYFDAGIGHWWVHNATKHPSLNIYSASPVLRYYFKDHTYFYPFLELSIGVAYLSQTYINHNNLGMHFAFQDRFGIGTLLGKEKRVAVALSAMHYSNASMSKWNAGMTIPLLLDVEYRF